MASSADVQRRVVAELEALEYGAIWSGWLAEEHARHERLERSARVSASVPTSQTAPDFETGMAGAAGLLGLPLDTASNPSGRHRA